MLTLKIPKYLLVTVLVILFTACGNKPLTENSNENKPLAENSNITKIIIDTDMLTDNDDAGALAVAHALSSKGELHILAMMISGIDLNQKRTKLISAINYYYDRPTIPIGENDRNKNNPKNRANWSPFSLDYSAPSSDISNAYNGNITYVDNFPSDDCRDRAYRQNIDCGTRRDAVALYCDTLNDLPDGEKVTIAVIGNFYNVSDLLNETTLCNGKELIKNKVEKLVCSGWFNDKNVPDTNFAGSHKNKSNFTVTIKATQNVFTSWPSEVPIVILNEKVGDEPGMDVGSLYQTYNTHSPMAFAYAVDEGHTYGKKHAIVEGKSVWDHTVILYAARGLKHNGTNYWSNIPGTATIKDDGGVVWSNNTTDKFNHHYLKQNNSNYISVIRKLFEKLKKFNPQD